MECNLQIKKIRNLAKSWNNLDLKFVEDDFLNEITYESQLIFNTINGKQAVKYYFENKFKAIRKAMVNGIMSIKAEIATHPSVLQPFFILSQIYDNKTEQLSIIPKVENGKITRIDACIIPMPENCKLTGDIPK